MRVTCCCWQLIHQFELYICTVPVHEAFLPQSKHMQIRGINDSKLPIGLSVTYYVNPWLLCDKLAVCPGYFPAFIYQRMLWKTPRAPE